MGIAQHNARIGHATSYLDRVSRDFSYQFQQNAGIMPRNKLKYISFNDCLLIGEVI
jgi:hypothetical protein